MKTMKNGCSLVILNCIILAASHAHAVTMDFTLNNVKLEDGTQLLGTFAWTYDVGQFESGAGAFTFLDIPWSTHGHLSTNATIDVGESIEITLAGNFHDDGVDIALILAQPLTPTTSSLLVLGPGESKYEIGGNGSHSGLFTSGSISPVLVPEPSVICLFLSGLATFGFTVRRRR